VKVQWDDREKIMDFIEKVPDITVILEIPKYADITERDWATMEMYNDKLDFYVTIQNLFIHQEVKEHGLRFYWPYPITSYYELRGIIALEPSYLLLGVPLCLDLKTVKSITNIPLRLIANTSYDPYIPRENGICGQWIRPEDVPAYEEYVTALEFVDANLTKEATLLHIYKENGYWPGNLNLLFDNFNFNVDNRAIPEDLGERRMNCRQRCMRDGTCHWCVNALQFADLIRKRHEEQVLSNQ
jgi:hypothetical protein